MVWYLIYLRAVLLLQYTFILNYSGWQWNYSVPLLSTQSWYKNSSHTIVKSQSWLDKTTKTCWSRRKYQLWILGKLYFYKIKIQKSSYTITYIFVSSKIIHSDGLLWKINYMMKKILQTTHDRKKTVSLSVPDPEYN